MMIHSPIAQGLPTAEGLKAVLYPIYHVVNRVDTHSFCVRTLPVMHFQGGLLLLNGSLHDELSFYEIWTLCLRTNFCSQSDFPCPAPLSTVSYSW